jgi:hypothetical protein
MPKEEYDRYGVIGGIWWLFVQIMGFTFMYIHTKIFNKFLFNAYNYVY